eukprot:GHVS01037304.1.p1 GENE.GHVS01037304.1~~GHVS01037304.1.p1  ORF type:complete len:297 (+),score=32.91 GHVS01037304.1:25-891(+)
MLLFGPAGTGKTSTILAVAKHLYATTMNQSVLQFNASDDRGISVVRNEIKSFSESRGVGDVPKLVVLDEADQMTQPAQNALRRIMEEFASNVRFCLICNYVSKIHDAIQSRCTRFRFHPLRDEHIKATVDRICAAEDLELAPDGLQALLKTGHGDMRRILNTMQCTQMAHPGTTLTAVHIMTTLGLPSPADVQTLLAVLLDNDYTEAMRQVHKFVRDKGFSLANLAASLQQLSHTLAIPETSLIQLAIRLGDIERRLADGASETVEAGALVASFVEVNVENYNVKAAA